MHELVSILVPLLREYGYIFLLVGTIFAGETVILAASFLASLGFFNIYIVIGISLIGTVVSDNIWYYIGRKSHDFVNKWYDKLRLPRRGYDFINKNFNQHYSKFLFISKYVYGTSTITLIMAGRQKMNYRKFFILNSISTIVWLGVIVSLGYAVGFSWNRFEDYNNYSRYWILAFLAAIIVIRLIVSRVLKYNKHESRN